MGKRCRKFQLDWKAFEKLGKVYTGEKRKYWAGFLIEDAEIKKALNLTKDYMVKLYE